jgi:hypothetical protein
VFLNPLAVAVALVFAAVVIAVAVISFLGRCGSVRRSRLLVGVGIFRLRSVTIVGFLLYFTTFSLCIYVLKPALLKALIVADNVLNVNFLFPW